MSARIGEPELHRDLVSCPFEGVSAMLTIIRVLFLLPGFAVTIPVLGTVVYPVSVGGSWNAVLPINP